MASHSSAEYQRQWRQGRLEKQRQYSKTYRLKNLDKERERLRKYHAANQETISKRKRLNYIKRTYGIGEETLEALCQVQNGKCAICQRGFTDERTPNVDHDHEDDRVRGLLCHDCNVMLGFAHDSTKTLQRAILYLQR